MPKEEWGTKRVCPTTGKRFYDLNKDPIVSPYTGEVLQLDTGKRTMLAPDSADGARRAANKKDDSQESDLMEDDVEVELDDDDVLEDEDDDNVSLDDIADVSNEDEES
ncbi:TIGR02300 family protein [Salipiger mucosus]|uniref:Transcription initiation factor TFIIIB, Brf1 subunit/Transcription initiation factor TFIIB n=1 Tax=Salipiger mucosus DSM 16094 TaxID=1123237 RepID=S9R4E7_9RHOB|nr:TIGR02300 family protein [Salipiger mucosus]EPX86797.1 Transcription initiation factor TFIIIB, Brf1 subunit/Transcription initiation factor TFIIB [Salipiger mucosus DSM 16094]